MSQKRKLDEFHDPDYSKIPRTSSILPTTPVIDKITDTVEYTKSSSVINSTVEQRIQKIKITINNEFEKDLNMKEEEIMKIQNHILLTKKLLHRLRYAIVSSYYNKKVLNSNLNASDNNNDDKSDNNIAFDNGIPTYFGTVKANTYKNGIHPAVKKLLSTKESNYEDLFKIRPMRKAAKTAKTTISEKLRSKKDQKKLLRQSVTLKALNNSNVVNNKVDSRSKQKNTSPIKCQKKFKKPIEQLNVHRGHNQVKHLIAIGNTSEYIGINEKSCDGATHKWLLYVKNKTETEIEKFISKIRFFLHPSYKPNDIIDVSKPPFQIVKRGWGEFPVRIQLHFKEHLNQKPLQVFYNLVLDKTLSGIQTIGDETLVEVWLRSNVLTSLLTKTLDSGNSKISTSTITRKEEKINDQYKIKFVEEENLDKNNDCYISLADVSNNIPKTICHDDNNILKNLTMITSPSNSLSKMPLLEIFSENQILSNPDNSIQNVIIENKDKEKQNIEEMKISTSTLSKLNNNNNNNNDQKMNEISSSNNIATISTEANTDNTSNRIITANVDSHGDVNKFHNLNSQYIPSTTTTILNTLETTNTPLNVMVTNILKSQQLLLSNKTNCPPINQTPPNSNNDTAKNFITNQIYLKDGKMFVIDPMKLILKQQQNKKQESLLKPQISLLKPIKKNNNLTISTQNENKKENILNCINSIAMDHNYTQFIGMESTKKLNIKDTIISSVLNGNNKNLKSFFTTKNVEKFQISNDYNKNNCKTSFQFTMKNKFELYGKEFCKQFNGKKFINIRCAVEYLLRKFPIVYNEFSIGLDNNNYHNENILNEIISLKRKAIEWHHAKYISILLRNHDQLNKLKMWTTKEIILFARNHVYTPTIIYKCNNNNNNNNNNSINENVTNDNVLNNLTHKESININNKKCTFNTVSSVKHITDWIDKINHIQNDLNKTSSDINDDDNEISITDLDNNSNDDENINKLYNKNKNDIIIDNNKNIYNNNRINDNIKNYNYKELLIRNLTQIDKKYENEINLVNKICNKIGIQFQPEEIYPNIIHHSTHLVLAKTLQIFIEDLIRRTAYEQKKKSINNSQKSSSSSSSSSSSIIIEINDIKRTILKKPQFDFLTNKYLGVNII